MTQTQTTPPTSTSSTSVPRETSPATSPEVPLTRTFPSSTSLPVTSASSASSLSSTQLGTSYPAFTHEQSTVPHIGPPVTTHQTTATTSISSTSRTSVSTEVPLETSANPSSLPAPSSPLSTQLPSTATSPLSSALASTVSTTSVPTSLTTSTFRSAESTTHPYFQNTTLTPHGKTSSFAVPTSISAQSRPALIPTVLSTTITFAPHVITTASTESVEQSSLRTTTLTTARTTSSPPLTSGLSTSLSSVVPSTVPHGNVSLSHFLYHGFTLNAFFLMSV
ncbi:uncharacterized protein RBU47_003318 [Passerculus sandwichensis]